MEKERREREGSKRGEERGGGVGWSRSGEGGGVLHMLRGETSRWGADRES